MAVIREGGFVNARVEGTSPGVVTLSPALRDTGLFDPLAGVYCGTIISPDSFSAA